MALVLFSWLVGLWGLAGVGAALSRRLRLTMEPLDVLFTGVAATVIVVNAWHLARPIDGWLCGVLGLVALWGWWRAPWIPLDGPGRLTGVLIALAALPLSNLALEATPNGDSGVYHLAAIQWARRAALTPGLGNLEPFLGYGHGFSQFAALFSQGPLAGRAHHVVNGLFALSFLGLTVRGGLALVMGTVTARAAATASLLPWAVFVILRRDLASGSSDLAEVALGAALFVSWIDTFEVGTGEREPRLRRVVVLATALVVLKFSSAMVAAAAVALAMALAGSWRRAAMMGVSSMLGVVPVVIGMVVRTGYFPFPGALVAFPVDWRMPRVVADGITGMVLGYGRRRLSTLGDDPGGSWMVEVAIELLNWNQEFVLPMLFLFGGLLVTVVVPPRPPAGRWLIMALPLVGVMFWFMTSPYVGYAGIWLQGLGAAGLAMATLSLKARGDVVLLRVAAIGLAVASLVRAGSVVEVEFLRFAHRDGFEETTVETRWERTASGLEVRVPVRRGAFCWNAEQPCTPVFDPWLRLRDPAHPELGFRWEPPRGTTATPAVVEAYRLDRAVQRRSGSPLRPPESSDDARP